MTLRQILTTIVGYRIGLENGGALLVNKTDGTQVVVDQYSTSLSLSQLSGDVTKNSAAIDLAVAAMGSGGGSLNLTTPGTYLINDTVLLPSYVRMRIAAGVTLKLSGTYGRTMLRNGNACTTGNMLIGACFVICADTETTSGTGTIRSVSGPARLAYKAPGDTEGSLVDVSAADGKYTLISSNGQSIYVSVARGQLVASVTQNIKVISACDGARSATWSRNTTTLTITEAGHNRRVGDAVSLFGTSVIGVAFIESISGSTWTTSDTRGAGSGSCRVFGSRSIELSVDNGAWIDYDYSNHATTLSSNDTHALIFNSITRLSTPGLRVINVRKYAFYATAFSDIITRDMELPDTQADGWHLNCPGKVAICNGLTGKDGDNLTALGGSDFAPYVINWTSEWCSNGGDISDVTIDHVKCNNHTEILRLYGSAGRIFRNIAVRDAYGVLDPTTVAAVAMIVDTVTPVESAADVSVDGLTIERIDLRRSDGGEVRVFSDISALAGAGFRKNVVIRDITLPDPMGDSSNPISTGAGKVGAIAVAGLYDMLRVERVHSRLAFSTGYSKWKGTVVDVQAGAVIASLHIDDVRWDNDTSLLPTSTFSAVVKIEPSSTVTDLVVSRINIAERAGSPTNRAIVVYNNGGTSTAVTVRGVEFFDGDSIVRIASTATANPTIVVDDVYANRGATLCVTHDVAASVSVSNIRGVINGLMNSGAASGTSKLRGMNIVATLNAGLGAITAYGSGTHKIDANGVELVVDITNAIIDRTSNKGNIVKTKAAAGTIPAGVLAVCDDSGAANSWKAVHNTTLVF